MVIGATASAADPLHAANRPTPRAIRLMGPTHPKHLNFQDDLRRARAVLALARGEIDADACMEAFTRKNVGRISTSC